jgi:hypothetical protein
MAEIEKAKVRIDSAGMSRERAERIARLVFYHLHAAMASGYLDFGPARAITSLQIPALEIDSGEMTDDAIARRGAAWVFRWLRAAQ